MKFIKGDKYLFQNSSGDSEGKTPRGRKICRCNQALKIRIGECRNALVSTV